MCSFVCNIVYESFACVCDRQFALRKNNGSISAVTQHAAVVNTFVFRLACFGGVAYCLKSLSLADGLPSVYLGNGTRLWCLPCWVRRQFWVYVFFYLSQQIILPASSRVFRSNCLIVLTDNPVRQQSYSSQ